MSTKFEKDFILQEDIKHTNNKHTNKRIILWKNPRTSSPRFYRPIRIQFLHKNTAATLEEVDDIKQQERNLVSFEIVSDGKEMSVSFQLALTMIDGKVFNAITNNAFNQRSYLCQATSKESNKIDKILRKRSGYKWFTVWFVNSRCVD